MKLVGKKKKKEPFHAMTSKNKKKLNNEKQERKDYF